MSQCPITYAPCSPEKYSLQGLKKLHKGLTTLQPFHTISLQEITHSDFIPFNWPFSCVLGRINAKAERMEVVEHDGKFLLFPPSRSYWQVPQNLDLSLRMAHHFGLPVPFHGLIHNQDGTLTCFVACLHVTQTDPLNTIYTEMEDYSIESIAARIDQICTFPVLEKYRFFQRLIFSWLIGFEIQHPSNYLFHQVAQKIELAPAQFLFNSILPFGSSQKAIGLSIRNKWNGFEEAGSVEYTSRKLLGLTTESTHFLLSSFQKTYSSARSLVLNSFLSEELKEQYLDVVVGRLSYLKA